MSSGQNLILQLKSKSLKNLALPSISAPSPAHLFFRLPVHPPNAFATPRSLSHAELFHDRESFTVFPPLGMASPLTDSISTFETQVVSDPRLRLVTPGRGGCSPVPVFTL